MPNDIKWIKITTEMFADEKIKLIEGMPEADTLIVIWIRLICMAGKNNDGGYIYFSQDIPYTVEQLAVIFGRPLNTVKLAIETFKRFQMIEQSEDGVIFLPHFERHQNLEGMDRVRQLNAKRNQVYRTRHNKQYLLNPSIKDDNSDVSVTLRDAPDKSRLDKNILEQNRGEVPQSNVNAVEVWGNVKNHLKEKINRANFATWFEKTEGVSFNNGSLIVRAPANAIDYLLKNHYSLIDEAVISILGEGVKIYFEE